MPGGAHSQVPGCLDPSQRALSTHTPLHGQQAKNPPCVLLSAPTPVVEPLTEPLLDPGWGSDSRPVWPLGL